MLYVEAEAAMALGKRHEHFETGLDDLHPNPVPRNRRDLVALHRHRSESLLEQRAPRHPERQEVRHQLVEAGNQLAMMFDTRFTA